MSLVAEFSIPVEALPMGETLTSMPDMQVEIERIVPTQESAFPFFWVQGSDPEGFLERVQGESEIREVKLLDRMEDRALFRAEWAPDAELIRGLEELDGTIIECVASSDHWRFEVRAQERDAFTRFQRVFEDEGVPIELTRLFDLSELVEGEKRPLTEEQRETLLRAYREGYFEKPREVTQGEIGEFFGVSNRAISDRLRRGIRNLIASTLLPEGDSQ